MKLGELELFYLPSVVRPEMLEIDVLIGVCCLLTFLHLIVSKDKFRNFFICTSLLAVTIFTEEASILLGQTHCHSDATAMVLPCSSVNSVLFYIPCTYASIRLAERVFSSGFGFAPAVGFFNTLFGCVYEIQGPTFRWWKYTDSDLGGPFTERAFGFPVMAILFHSAFGFGFALALQLIKFQRENIFSFIGKFLAVFFFSPLIALIFAQPVNLLSSIVSRYTTVFISLFAFFLLPLIFAKPALNSKQSYNFLNLLTVLIWNGYFISYRFWHSSPKPVNEEMYAVSLLCGVSSIIVHLWGYFGYYPQSHPQQQQQQHQQQQHQHQQQQHQPVKSVSNEKNSKQEGKKHK